MKRIEIEHNKELKPLNTFGIAARASGFVAFRDRGDLAAIFADPSWSGKSWYVMSGGSNILLTGDYDGLILHPVARAIEEVERDGEAVTLRVQAGLAWDELVAYCVTNGYGGLENLSGIPGFVGAAPVQNIGAYGAEVKDTIAEVEAYRFDTGVVQSFTNAECRFGYRDSVFKHEERGSVILSVTFRLPLRPHFSIGYGDLSREVEALGGASLSAIRQAVLSIRAAKLPDPKVLGNSGSFFKNPVVSEQEAEALRCNYPDMPVYLVPTGVKLAAGWLIDRAGLKGYRQGRVGVHEKQALVLVNYGGATGGEVLALADHVIVAVRERFGVSLVPEVNVL
ncbi:MAG: UDP-N-acetylmuramate dehydrogenase [Rikenellaceae bacterium]|jgi:UDP-N-acetylmuramate dehydrogenase|nr:UDP-N-acetylmuramate dehydrogenase [Rikenellaceae bacterium]